jgi:hypothetical protein
MRTSDPQNTCKTSRNKRAFSGKGAPTDRGGAVGDADQPTAIPFGGAVSINSLD